MQFRSRWISGSLELFEDALVDFHVLAAQNQIGFLALVATQIANDLVQKRAERRERQHQQLLGVLQQVIDELADGQMVLICRTPQSDDFGFQRAYVVVGPFDERRNAALGVVRIGLVLRHRTTQELRLRLHASPRLVPGFELIRERAELDGALA